MPMSFFQGIWGNFFRLKTMSGKEKQFSKDVNHQISKKLANKKDTRVFVLEDLKGIRNQRKGKKLNKRLNSWPCYQFASFLEYKAEQSGKIVAYVDARYTSQKCSCCRVILKKTGINQSIDASDVNSVFMQSGMRQ